MLQGFYHTVAAYIKNKMLKDGDFLMKAEVFDLGLIQSESFSSVQYFTDKYAFLCHDKYLQICLKYTKYT